MIWIDPRTNLMRSDTGSGKFRKKNLLECVSSEQ